MKQEWIFLFGISLIPPFIVVVFPSLSFIGPSLLVLGLLVIFLIGWRSSFRQNKYGMLAQWVEPSKFVKMKFDLNEIRQLKIAGSFVLSGFLVMLVIVFRLNLIK